MNKGAERLFNIVIGILGVILHSKRISWLSSLSLFSLGIGLIYLILFRPAFAILFVSILTIIGILYLFLLTFISNKKTLRLNDIGEQPTPSYRTQNTTIEWTILDKSGSQAIATRYREIIPLEPISQVREFAWGDANPPSKNDIEIINDGKQHKLGRIYREGSRWIVEIILDHEYDVGEGFHLEYVNKLHNPFTGEMEWTETTVESETENLEMKVTFPKGRQYLTARSIRRYGDHSKTYLLNADPPNQQSMYAYEDETTGVKSLIWPVKKPALGTVYSIVWDW